MRLAENRLDINIDSWTPFLIQRASSVVNNLFRTQEEVVWWTYFAVKVFADVAATAEWFGKPIAVAVKAIADVNVRLHGYDIAEARSELTRTMIVALVRHRDSERLAGRTFIQQYLLDQPYVTLHEINRRGQALAHAVERRYPHMSEADSGRLSRAVEEVMAGVRAEQARQAQAQQRQARARARAQAEGDPATNPSNPAYPWRHISPW